MGTRLKIILLWLGPVFEHGAWKWEPFFLTYRDTGKILCTQDYRWYPASTNERARCRFLFLNFGDDDPAMRKRGPQYVTPSGNNEPIFGEPILGIQREELDYLFSLTYEELRRLAAAVKSSDPAATLNPTALVHEAWMKLAKSPSFSTTSQLHFKRIAARAMRQLLVESARRRQSQKRGGEGEIAFVLFEEAEGLPVSYDDEVVRLDSALEELARLNPRQAQMVESRFFGGLEANETAELLNVSEATVLRDWRVAKAWLASELRRER
jgi:RNA polymerase sigma factor (TIGR02999 family)